MGLLREIQTYPTGYTDGVVAQFPSYIDPPPANLGHPCRSLRPAALQAMCEFTRWVSEIGRICHLWGVHFLDEQTSAFLGRPSVCLSSRITFNLF